MEYSKSREIKGKRYYRRGWEMEKEENETGSKIEKNTKIQKRDGKKDELDRQSERVWK